MKSHLIPFYATQPCLAASYLKIRRANKVTRMRFIQSLEICLLGVYGWTECLLQIFCTSLGHGNCSRVVGSMSSICLMNPLRSLERGIQSHPLAYHEMPPCLAALNPKIPLSHTLNHPLPFHPRRPYPGVSSITSSTALPFTACAFLSALNASIFAIISVSGTTSSIFRGARLKGSFGSERRCERMVERSMVVREVGRMTGSVMRVNMRGSGCDLSAHNCFGEWRRWGERLTQKLVGNLSKIFLRLIVDLFGLCEFLAQGSPGGELAPGLQAPFL